MTKSERNPKDEFRKGTPPRGCLHPGANDDLGFGFRPALRDSGFRHSGFGCAGAFTLMELLLAIAVMAIVLVAINGVFFSALRLRNSVSNGLDESVPLEHAIAVMRRDLQNTTPPGGILQGGLQSGVVNGT